MNLRILIFIMAFTAVIDSTHAKVTVFVSIPPQAYLVEQLAGSETIDTHLLVRPGQDPHTFEPTPQQIIALSQASVYFRIGLPFEDRILPKITSGNGKLTVVDCRKGITMIPAPDIHHEHGHDEPGSDPHIWLSPENARIIASTMYEALSGLVSLEARPGMETRYRDLSTKLETLDHTLRRSLAPFAERSVLVFHPAFGYFCAEYGLKQVFVESEGKQPGPKYLDQLIRKAQSENIRIILVQPQFDSKTADVIARAINGKSLEIDPLAYDIPKGLESIRDAMLEAMATDAAGR